MWSDEKQRRLEELRQYAQDRTLTADEQRTLDQLVYELEQQEWIALRPALDRFRDEQRQLQDDLGQLQAQNAILSALAARYDDLIARARVQLGALADERDALHAEYDRVFQS